MLNTVFLVVWNMISQSAVFFSWKFLADDFWLCIFASWCSRNHYLPGQPAPAPFLNTLKHFSSLPYVSFRTALGVFMNSGAGGLAARSANHKRRAPATAPAAAAELRIPAAGSSQRAVGCRPRRKSRPSGWSCANRTGSDGDGYVSLVRCIGSDKETCVSDEMSSPPCRLLANAVE